MVDEVYPPGYLTDRARVDMLLRDAAGEPVTVQQLQEAGIHQPARHVEELVRLGYPIAKHHDTDGLFVGWKRGA